MANPISQYPVRIYYEDTDAGALVYHANYIKYMERARTEFLRELKIEQSTFLTQNIAFVVTSMNINYKASARLDDLLNVKSSITKLKRASVEFLQEIYNQNGQLICSGAVMIASVNLAKNRPCAIPKEILGVFQSVC